ncbi:ATP phosphoribosyltransferase [Halopenitus salinus]|uniref:ATP phosphoribosyltransferase n=1 Tax=Halopenitus salinus TaxID=1198295 RepID=A0ABD5UYR5_9EURY
MRIAVPNKGRLHEPTIELLERAGLHLERTADRQLYADTVDPDVSILFARAADIPEYVRDGAADLGITGLDQAVESGAVVERAAAAGSTGESEEDTDGDGAGGTEDTPLVDLLDLGYGTCRLVLAAPEDGEIGSVADLEGRTVATEFPGITRSYFETVGVDAEIVTVTGATELTPHVEMADAIVDITSTGTTLKVNRLAVIDEVLESSVRLFARSDVVEDGKVREVMTALESVLAAEDKRYLMMNAPTAKLPDVKDVLPGLGGPTVMDVEADENGDGMVAVHAVVDEGDVFSTITDLKAVGATGILVTEIERLVE